MIIKKILYITTIFIFATLTTKAQTIEEVLRLSTTPARQYTARVTAMGGAFTSLGADASSMNINPAGLGMYITGDISTTFNYNITNTNIDAESYNGQSILNKNTNQKFNLSNISGVVVLRNTNRAVKNFVIGISYNRVANFDRRYTIDAPLSNGSISDLYSRQLKYIDPDFLDYEYKSNSDKQGIQEAVMNYKNLMIDPTKEAPWEYSINPTGLEINDQIYQTRSIDRDGHTNNYSISGGMNINNILYIGTTFGIRTFSLYENNSYYENGINSNIGDFKYLRNTSNLYQEGSSFDFKIGTIVQPIEGLKIGLSYHAPRSTHIEENYNILQSVSYKNDYYQQKTGDITSSYKIVSSHRLLTGISYRFGSLGIISFDYILNLKGSIKIKDINGAEELNNYLQNSLKNNNEYKIGLEIQPFKGLFTRAGYSYIETPYSDKYLSYLSDYGENNIKKRRQFGAQHYASLGAGYRFMNLYFELAYQYIFSKTPSYMLYGESFNDVTITSESQISEEIHKHMLSFSCGVRF